MMLEELVKLTELARGQGVAVPESRARLLDGPDGVKASGRDVRRE